MTRCPFDGVSGAPEKHIGPVERRQLNTQYANEESNFITSCLSCFEDCWNMYEDRWAEYYDGQGFAYRPRYKGK